MANIQLFDGTNSRKSGEVFGMALEVLRQYQPVTVSPPPGILDRRTYDIAHYLETKAFNGNFNQVNLDAVLELADSAGMGEDNSCQSVILLRSDAFGSDANGRRLNWAFGAYTPYRGHDYVVLSIKRLRNNPELMFDIMAHEVGHMFGAASPGRSNTEESPLGTHCANDLCVMRYTDSFEQSLAYAQRRLAERVRPYCPQCEDELRR